MLTKELVIETVNGLPDEFSIDDLIDEIIFKEKVIDGLNQSAKGEVYTTEEAKEILGKWLK